MCVHSFYHELRVKDNGKIYSMVTRSGVLVDTTESVKRIAIEMVRVKWFYFFVDYLIAMEGG